MSRGVPRFLLAGFVSLAMLTLMTGPAAASRAAPAAAPATEVSSAPLNPAFVPSLIGARVGAQSSTPDGRRLGERPGPQDVPLARGTQAQGVRLRGTLPASYDLRALGRVTSVKDQNPYGTCWSFAACGSLESCLLPGECPRLLRGQHGPHQRLRRPGNPLRRRRQRSTCRPPTWSAGAAPSTRATTPTGTATRRPVSPRASTCRRSTGSRLAQLGARQRRHQERGHAITAPSTSRWAGTAPRRAPPTTTRRRRATTTTAASPTNHDVLIVGWDDDYAASNFATTPPGNGAFIVKNSWGTGVGQQRVLPRLLLRRHIRSRHQSRGGLRRC